MADFDPTNYDGDEAAAQADDFLLGLQADAEDEFGDPLNPKDALLFVIDCSQTSAAVSPEDSLVTGALSCAVSSLKNTIVSCPEHKIGIMLYGVREAKNPNNFAGIHVLQELDLPRASRIRELQVEEQRTPAQFVDRYGCDVAVPISDVFWTCTTIFNLAATNNKQWSSRVFLFTSSDSPCSSQEQRDAAETRARDLRDQGTSIELFAVQSLGGTFSMASFWGAVCPVDDDDFVGQVATKVEELRGRVRKREHRKRTLQRLSLEFSPGVEAGVCVYATLIPAAIPHPMFLLNENNKPLKSETKFICEQTGAILHPKDDLETYVCDKSILQGETVPISREEMNQLKKFGDPGMRLIGFKSREWLRSHHNMTHSYFVYPNERAIKGSAALCSALIEEMTARSKLALVRYIPRQSSSPAIAALLPQREVLDPDTNDLISSPGFHLVPIPFGEDIRPLHFLAAEGSTPSPEAVRLAGKVVDALSIGSFKVGSVENPVLQRHYAAVQALALGEDQAEEVEDHLQPPVEDYATRIPTLQEWWSAIDDGSHRVLRKRELPAGADVYSKIKTPRLVKEEEPFDGSVDLMRAKILSGEVDRLTVPVLRDFLKAQGKAAGGKKGELVERIRMLLDA